MPSIHSLIERGRSKLVQALIEANPQIVHQRLSADEADQPLHIAAWQNKVKIARLLVDNGADVDAPGDQRFTPLHYAARHGSVRVTQLLLSSGANPNFKDNFGLTPLLTAVRGREPSCLEVAQLLRENGSLPDLNSLVSLGDVEGVRLWLERDPNAIHTAIDSASLCEDAVIMIESKVFEELRYDASPQEQGELVAQYEDILLCLIRAGADVNQRGSTGHTPLISTIQSGILPLAKLLLEQGADVNFRFREGDRTIDALSFTGGSEGKEMSELLRSFGFQR